MQFRLCVLLGMDIDEIEKMDRWKLAEYFAYYRIEPWGFEAEQARNANVCHWLHLTQFGRRGPLQKLEGYMVKFTSGAIAFLAPAELKTKLAALGFRKTDGTKRKDI